MKGILKKYIAPFLVIESDNAYVIYGECAPLIKAEIESYLSNEIRTIEWVIYRLYLSHYNKYGSFVCIPTKVVGMRNKEVLRN